MRKPSGRLLERLRSPSRRVGSWRFDSAMGVLRRGDQQTPLTPKASDLLRSLVAAEGKLVTRDELFQALWGGRYRTDDALNQIVMELRRALEDDPRQPRFIQTVRGRGYRLVATRRAARWRVAAAIVALASVLVIPGPTGNVTRNQERIAQRLAILPVQDATSDASRQTDSARLVQALRQQLDDVKGAVVTGLDSQRVDRWVAVRVFESADGVRYEVDLIDAAAGVSVWSSSYRSLVMTPDFASSVAAHVSSAVIADISLMCIETLNLRNQRPV